MHINFTQFIKKMTETKKCPYQIFIKFVLFTEILFFFKVHEVIKFSTI